MTETIMPISGNFRFQNLPGRILASVPLPTLQPALRRVVRRMAQRRPELFRRLGTHKDKVFLIDPVNLPFVLLLKPEPDQPLLRAYRRNALPRYDARIAGTFLTLLDMVDGRLDGDALFFTRDLLIEGDTEAIVTLRNALDDLEGSIIDDVADVFGPIARMALSALRRIRP